LPDLQRLDCGADRVDAPDDFVSWNDGQLRLSQLTVEHVQIGTADAAGTDPHANLARARLTVGQLAPFECGPGPLQHHRLHQVYLNVMATPNQDAGESVIVPHGELEAETLRAVVESFVLREGTDYGRREFTLPEKVAHVMAQLARGEAQIVFEPESQSIHIVRTK